jgi:hypothetical protein
MRTSRLPWLLVLSVAVVGCSSNSTNSVNSSNTGTDGGGDDNGEDPSGGSGGEANGTAGTVGTGGTVGDAGIEPDGAVGVGGSGGAGADELPEGLIASGLEVYEVQGSGLTDGGGVLDGIGYFFTEREEGLTLVSTDGTVDGTQSVAAIAEAFSGDPAIVFSMADSMYWMGPTADDGQRWFSSDGTAAGTQVIAGGAQIDPGGTRLGARLGDIVVFERTSTGTRGLSTLDLTTGTQSDISDTQVSIEATGGTFTLVENGYDVFLTDGFDAPILVDNPENAGVAGAIQLGDEMLFWLNFGSGHTELWKTTYTGVAEKVTDSQAFQQAVIYQDKVYGISKTASTDVEYGLWETDGTAAGTKEVVVPGRGLEDELLLATDGGLFFLATYEQEAGLFLYKSDGTAAGTTRVFSDDILYSGRGSGPVVVGDYLYVGFEWGPGGTANTGLARVPTAGGAIEYVDTPDCAVFNMVAAGNHLIAQCNYGTLRLLGNAGD